MNLKRIGVITRLELTQRLRSPGWYVLLGIFLAVLLGVTVLAFMGYSYTSTDVGVGVYAVIVNIVLLLVVLVSPTLSGTSINGDREAATLAPVQVTLATTGDIMLGKLFAAVITGLAFVVVAVPFLVVSIVGGARAPLTLLVSLAILILEIVVVAAIGVGLSGLIARPLFSVAATYLVIAALVIGTPIAFMLAGTAIRTDVTSHSRPYDANGEPVCDRWDSHTYETMRGDLVWGVLAANPFVVLADATPVTFDDNGWPVDIFGSMKFGVRQLQQAPQDTWWDDCAVENSVDDVRPQEVIESTTPLWAVGLGIHVVLAGSLFAGAWRRTRTPAHRMPPGTRIS
ncbi:ABC transporter permease [Microbacterium sp. YY-01]|uniref:ABC transporter permease n=1 Tax=Microbacterium sp. YY-01 TaxID=3421634 RepID=UPI003D167935